MNAIPGASTSWNIGNGQTYSNTDSLNYVYHQSGCYDIQFQISLNGCSSQLILNDEVCVEEIPTAAFTFVKHYDLNEYTVEFTNQSIGAIDYYWNFGGLGTSTEENPSFNFPASHSVHTICLTVSSDLGCSDEVCQPIPLEDPLIFYVPNTFTPDGDQFNQVFKPVFTSGFDPFDYTLLIYNRWGECVFESHNAETGWDGTYNGILAPDGIYTWKIEFKTLANDERKIQVGHITLMR